MSTQENEAHRTFTIGSDEDILVLKGIEKSFPGIKAVDGVDLNIKRGEVHALIGENGAGKSTLMKVVFGIHEKDKGDIYFNGKRVDIQHPSIAKESGIVFVHQEISIVPELSVAENIFLGSIPLKSLKRINWSKLYEDARGILEELKCGFDEKEITGNLLIADQQMVEIARALAFNPKLIIFDEPTSSLTEKEKVVLFENIRKFKAKGISIIYISHRMEEIYEISDRITVLRDGKKTGTLITNETNDSEVTRLMVGRDIDNCFEKNSCESAEEVLRVEGLSIEGMYNDISFCVRRGEVLGLYGLVGAGRSEIAETIFGIRQPDNGAIFIDGIRRKIKNSKGAVKLGVGLIPEDRKNNGIIGGLSCRKNLSLAKANTIQKCGFINNKKEDDLFTEYKEKLSIKCSSPNVPISKLSGGNQQKIIISKWLANNPKLLILDEPTRGIDVGSKSQIHCLVRDLAQLDMGIIVISSEMPEIIGVCDRIITIYHGNITSELNCDELTEDNLVKGAMGCK